MEYERLNRQLKIHWHWLRQNADPEGVYKTLKLWVDTDTEGLKRETQKDVKKIENGCTNSKLDDGRVL